MQFFYNLFIHLYAFSVWLIAPFHVKAKKWHQGRKKSWNKLENFSKQYPENIWVHCASVGEFEQGKPLIEKLQNEYPSYKILLSFFSPSGYEMAEKKYPDLDIIYLPSDTKKNSLRWMETLKPQAAFFIKYEFWHHYFLELKNKDIPLFMVSAIFWKELFFFKNYAAFFRKALKNVTHFFVQNEESKRLLAEIGLRNVSVNGDLRFERVIELKNSPFSDKKIEKFKGSHKIFMAGSAWSKDIPVLKKIITHLPTEFKVIIAPHEPFNFDYSAFDFASATYYSEPKFSESKILFLDTIGILSKAYRYAHLSYVGGGFGSGIHNILEPAVYNLPILIGPNNERFAEAQILKKIGLALEIKSAEDIPSCLEDMFSMENAVFEKNNELFDHNTNATEQILVFIKKEGILS